MKSKWTETHAKCVRMFMRGTYSSSDWRHSCIKIFPVIMQYNWFPIPSSTCMSLRTWFNHSFYFVILFAHYWLVLVCNIGLKSGQFIVKRVCGSLVCWRCVCTMCRLWRHNTQLNRRWSLWKSWPSEVYSRSTTAW